MTELERGAFLEKDAKTLEEIAAGFERVKCRPRMPGPRHAEKAKADTELFHTKARQLRAIAARIRRVLA